MKKTISIITSLFIIIAINTNIFATNPAEAYFPADIEQGYIGISTANPTDNPTDNVFKILLNQQLQSTDEVWLTYELYGVSDHTHISRSINDQLAVGGQLVQLNDAWNTQREQVNPIWLNEGENIIRFTLPDKAAYHYQIKNLGIQIKKVANNGRSIIVNQPANQQSLNNLAYLKGFVQGKGSETAQLYANDIPVRTLSSEFETLKFNPGSSENWTVSLKAVFEDGEVIEESVHFTNSEEAADMINEMPLAAASYAVSEYLPTEAFTAGLSHAEISIEPEALAEPTPISITALRKVDIPPMDMGMINVTKNSEAYRFLPHGTTFTKTAKIKLAYDESKIPDGYTTKDIRTYYFDERSKHWVALPLDTVLAGKNTLISKTTHFTDMINGIIKAPESPETGAFTPTSIKDIKACDPSANINTIEPPSANNMGNANLGYPIVLPAGRQGMQPQLGIQYNSGGGNGWCGLGWNLSIPAVTIETRWGVPRYDPELETETYTLNGAQLAPVAHRNEFVPRTGPTKQFHPRVEGNFDRIIRHGNSSKNYWWEVTDKSGTINSYGGLKGHGIIKSSVLTDDEGNIAHWALVETRDLNNNFVRYHCNNVTTNGGREIYVERITYTGHAATEGKYEVLFTRDTETNDNVVQRKDITVNCMLGFKRVTADLLKKIEVNFDDQPVRSYELLYEEGAFYKTLLTNVIEYDAAGNQFTKHEFDYYDDVQADKGYIPFEEQKIWTTDDDGVEGPITLDGFFEDDASSIGANKSNGKGFSTAITAGPFDGNLASKSNTIGGSFGFDFSDNEGLLALVDINGDGLPDKVYKTSSGLMFRANESRPGGAEKFADDPTGIVGIGDFSKGKSKTRSLGLESNFKVFLGYQNGKTTSTTSTYFADVNGDQLIDVVQNCVVYFNSIVDGVPTFTKSSADTPSPITANAGIDGNIVTIDEAEIAKEELESPLHDVIRVWIAPYDGTISITGDASLVMPAEVTGAEDGVRIAIQHKGIELWTERIEADDFSPHSVVGVNNVAITKGDKIFFRVQSIYEGTNDKVIWSPNITYDRHYSGGIDANALPMYQFNPAQDYLLTSSSVLAMPEDGVVTLEYDFSKMKTSDAITILVKKNDILIMGGRRTFPAAQEVTNRNFSSIDIPVSKGDNFTFELVTTTAIDWSKVTLKPSVYYTDLVNPLIPEQDSKGNYSLNFTAPVSHTVFNKIIKPTEKLFGGFNVNLTGTPQIKMLPGILPEVALELNGKIIFTAKKVLVTGELELFNKQTVEVVNGVILQPLDEIRVPVTRGDNIFYEYHTANEELANWVDPASLQIENRLLNDMIKLVWHIGLHTTTDKNEALGSMYRNWGQFAYNDSIRSSEMPFDETAFEQFLESSKETSDETPEVDFDALNISLTADSSFEDSQGLSDQINKKYEDSGGTNPAQTKFICLLPAANEGHYIGYDNLTYVHNDTISASRMGEDNLQPVLPIGELADDMEASGAIAIKKISKSYSNSFSLSGTIPGTSLSPSGNVSFGRSVPEYEYMDMNGDRHPDVVAIDKIQYTLPTGGLEDELTNVGFGEFQKGRSFSYGVSASGTFLKATLKSSDSRGKGSSSEEGQAKISVGLSGGLSHNNDKTNYALRDINADGLPDKVFRDGEVQLNLGYKFAPKETWNFNSGITYDEINKGSSTSGNAGLSFSIDNLSISGGISLSNSKNMVKNTLQDVNGDGLPDYIESVKPVKVRINTGYAFAEAIEWTGADAVNESNNVGESANGSYTFGIPLVPPFPVAKLCTNISANGSLGMSEEQVQISDLNGDGYPDYLTSDKDEELTVKYSTIRRTNMLREVKRPLGAVITMDYDRVGNTYEHPSNVWALDSVAIYDGFAGDGADVMATTFVYEDGYYDRHERDFYGFKTIKTNQHDTEKDDELYRTTVQEFLNTNYYQNGLSKEQSLQDADGNLYTRDISHYELKDVKTGDPLDALYAEDDGCAFPAMVLMEKKFYEGQAAAGKETQMEYDYDEWGNVDFYKDLGEPGDADDIFSTITYHQVLDNYIMNAPSSITVKGGTDEATYRYREADINTNNGNVTEMRMFLENGASANYTMAYDQYGNIAQLERPWNEKGERLTYQYTYDPEVHIYNTGVSDSYGYSSSATYDYRFGQMLTNTDLNDNQMRYTIDDVGRISTITGPFELAEGLPYTIAFEYYPSDFEEVTSYALTKHYDPQHSGNDIETYTFIDGLKRPLQIKKDGALFNAPWLADYEKMIISGRITFDAFGRAVENYHQTLEEQNKRKEFNNKYDIITPTRTEYDVLDRQTAEYLPDNVSTLYKYDFGEDRDGIIQFRTKIIDANGIWKESYNNIRKLTTASREQNRGGTNIWTSFIYNPINELAEVLDDHKNKITSNYDWLGRRRRIEHPDAGLSTYKFDLASNLTRKITSKLREKDKAIKYDYDFERLTKIRYPFNTYNDVDFEYGVAGAAYNRAGRIVQQKDATGNQRLWYDLLGNVTKNERTIHVPDCESLEFITKWTYDTWNRLIKMEYPDKEVVTYTYNVGGLLNSLNGLKKGTDYAYVKQLGYDKFEQRVYLHYGNNTETHYTYEEDRRRLKTMSVENHSHRKFIDYEYDYDAVTNITRFANHAGVEENSHLLGGMSDYNYTYDDLYRLTEASGYHKGSKGEDRYSLNMTYNNVHSIVNKDQHHERKINTASVYVDRKKTSYNLNYKYDEEKQPHAPIQVGDKLYTYDANGNQSGWDEQNDGNADDFRRILWDEEDRMAAINDNGAVFKYLYDADGDRVIKNTGLSQSVSINGDIHPLYLPEYWDKHWNNGLAWLEHWHGHHYTDHTHGSDDLEHHEYSDGSGHIHLPYDCLAHSSIYVNPYVVIRNRTVTKHFYIEDQRVVTKMADPYDELLQDDRGSIDELHDEEHGFTPAIETDVYFYHPDHLGTTGFVTQSFGEVNQHVEYFAFGETFLEERNNTTDRTPYLFNAKELDEETGLYFYGARYYDPIASIWLSIDPLILQDPAMDKETYLDGEHNGGVFNSGNLSSYSYTYNNPIIYVDPNGKQSVFIETRSFAPFNSFGKLPYPNTALHVGPFLGDGDNRVATTNPNATSRISGRLDLNLSTGKKTGSSTGKYTTMSFRTGESVDATSKLNSVSLSQSSSQQIGMHNYGHNKLVFGSPNIDAKVLASITKKENGSFDIRGLVYGDAFPSQELIFGDSEGNRIMLSNFDTKAGKNEGPGLWLPGNNNRDMGEVFDVNLQFNKDGELIKAINNKTGKEIQIDQY